MAERRPDRAADIAYHYHRSAAMSGAEAGVAPALAAAEVAEAAYAHDDVATFLRMALDLMPAGDVRRPRLLARLGLALTWALRFEEAVQAAGEAGDTIARTEGADAAADYLAAAAMGMNGLTGAGYWRGAWALAAQGLRYAGERRDATWVALKSLDILRAQVEDPDFPGHFLDTPARREVARVVERLPPIGEDDLQVLIFGQDFASRAEVLARARNSHWMFYAAGDFRASLRLFTKHVAEAERQGRLAATSIPLANIARCHNALGDFAAARAAYERAAALASRLTGPLPQLVFLMGARWEMCSALDVGLEEVAAAAVELASSAIDNRWTEAPFRAGMAVTAARLDRVDDALALLATLPPALERGWIVGNYTTIACLAAETLWLARRTDHLATIERAVRRNVVEPDFRYACVDGRLSLARLCALRGRYEEAADWFARARTVLDEQGARPLRAIADFDEAVMYQRRGTPGDRERALTLLESARRRFEELGMTGWLRRAGRAANELGS
jgi:tetratricopeptide (TPR) repeat protein